MKQKYMIFNGEKENQLIIQESAELDKGAFSVLLEEIYDSLEIKSAIEKDNDAVVATIRTKSFFPVSLCAERLAAAVTEFYKSGGNEPVEVQFDDLETLSPDKVTDFRDDISGDVELDDLLDDDSDKDDILVEDDIKDISSNASPILKVADDDGLGQDEDL